MQSISRSQETMFNILDAMDSLKKKNINFASPRIRGPYQYYRKEYLQAKQPLNYSWLDGARDLMSIIPYLVSKSK